ncbi:hypothetical protein [Halobellus ruber]|uniref:DUF1109 domain-containing protein n=1 Tax=Halobellus ruber TaxID=2761102 RepID=A0A7J9SMK1_9EURY|nr:hypothetical protein [Halobellus ruber]MBB6647257.1 hypothetical protein [Halobellus ruber]
MVDVDSETLFNAAAAGLTTVAVLVFVFNVDLGYSPVSILAVAAAFLAGVVAITQRTDDRQLTFLGYGVVVVSTVGVFVDLVNTLDLGSEVTVLGLLGIAAVLFSLRARLDDANRLVSGATATRLFGALAAVAVVIVVVDVVTGGLAYELQSETRIEIEGDSRQNPVAATVTVTNPTPLPERVDTPHYEACVAGDWSEYRRPAEPDRTERPRVRANLNVDDGYNDHVLGFSSRTYPAYLFLDAANVTGETFRVERTAACPDDDTGEPYIAVYEDSNRRYRTAVAV